VSRFDCGVRVDDRRVLWRIKNRSSGIVATFVVLARHAVFESGRNAVRATSGSRLAARCKPVVTRRALRRFARWRSR